MASSYDDVINMGKKMSIGKHLNDSNEELRSIVLRNGSFIQGLPMNGQISSTVIDKIGELQACKAILDAREGGEKQRKQKQKEWDDQLEVRKDSAALSLKAAATPNGQLITAILEEEDGKTKEEIAGFCDELSMLEDAEIDTLLNDLVSDGVIYQDLKTGVFSLYTICDGSLQWNREGALKRINHFFNSESDPNSYMSKRKQRDMKAIIELLDIQGGPICNYDVIDLAQRYKEVIDPNAVRALSSDNQIKAAEIDGELQELEKMGILVKAYKTYNGRLVEAFSINVAEVYTDDSDYYDFAFIGGAK